MRTIVIERFKSGKIMVRVETVTSIMNLDTKQRKQIIKPTVLLLDPDEAEYIANELVDIIIAKEEEEIEQPEQD